MLTCQKYANEWADFLKIITYFGQNPSKTPCYWRQLPIDVDLNALELYQPIIAELLNAVLPPSVIQQNEAQFEPRFGLLFDEPMLCVRFLDDNLNFPNIGNDIALPVSVLANWRDLPCENIFFISDKNVFLGFSKHPLSIAVLWEHSTDILSKNTWFQGKNSYFIGDLTVKGFEQLSEMRSVLPKLSPFLMDKTTFDAFPQHHQTLKIAANPSPFLAHLTPEEQAFYTFLFNLKEKNGLLQRSIGHAFLEKRLKNLEIG